MANISPIYLFSGPELGDRNDAVEKVKASHKKQFGQIDEHLFYLSENPLSQVMTILQSGTLFSDGVLIVCKNAELIKKKDDIQMISDWLKDAQPSSVLILVSDEITVDAKLEKLVPAANRKKCWEMFESDRLPWVMNFFSKNGYRIQPSAAQLVLDMVDNNKQALKNECSRFFVCFPKDHEITEDDVDSILIHNREESVFTLFNAMANPSDSVQERLEKSLMILQKVRLSSDNSPMMIIAGLSSCFRKLILWHRDGEGAFSGKLQRKQYSMAARVWTMGQTTAILAILSSTDMAIRTDGSLMQDVMLQKMLYEIILKKGAQISSLE